MERKIGEIFEYNGEWYQCTESPNGNCMHCDMNFGGKCPIPIKECTGAYRIDKKHIIFKKLKKVGEPITIAGKLYQKVITCNILCDYCFLYDKVSRKCSLPKIQNTCFGNEVYVEIKQNEEDMEEQHTIENYPTKEEKIAERIANKVGKEIQNQLEKNLKLKPFNLEAAKAGKPVCTRDGRKVRIICFECKGIQPIVGLETQENGDESIETYHLNGRFNYDDTTESKSDLMMLPEKKEGWANIVRGSDGSPHMGRGIFQSKEEAENTIKAFSDNLIDTVKICWEE